MPIKYIGRQTDFKGCSLWEILGNLKNFGVGRIVIRQMFQRYPEPSYMKILKVAALPPPTGSADELRKVRVLVERTFRGVKNKQYVQIEESSYKTDYQLIPKDQEARFTSVSLQPPVKLLPRSMDFPPLMKEFLIQQMKASGQSVSETPKLMLSYNKSVHNTYRVAKENETPTIEISSGLGKPASPSLYANVVPIPDP